MIVDILTDIHVMVSGYPWLVSPDCIAGLSVQLIEVTFFLKLSADQLIDCRLKSIMKRPCNKPLTNLVRSVIFYKEILDLSLDVLTSFLVNK